MMIPPRVSVIITSYNQQEYLREAIESAIDQTVAAFEIIVADDHSTKDGSIETIREYAARYPGLVRGLFQKKMSGFRKIEIARCRWSEGIISQSWTATTADCRTPSTGMAPLCSQTR